jgi:hypothetical protein
VRREVRCSFLLPATSTNSPHLSAAGSAGSSQAASASPAIGDLTLNDNFGLNQLEAFPVPSNRQDGLGEAFAEGLDVSDFSLLHHYTISTALTLVVVPGLHTFMRVNLPQLAFSNRFLLHAILAIAALHLSRFRKDAVETNYYMTKALHHHGIALRKATLLMQEFDIKTGPALYLFSTLCFSFTFGLGPQDGDFLLFGRNGVADWLAQLRGMRFLLETNPEILHHEVLSPLIEISIRNMAHTNSGVEHLPELRDQILRVGPPEEELKIYSTALDQLSERFDVVTGCSRASEIFPQQVYLWLYTLEDDYVRLLQEGKPIALVILSYFCILLNRLGSVWWNRGWAEHLLSEIHAALNQEYRIWMRRPMEETGWVPG